MNIAEPTGGICTSTDHASVVANLLIPADVAGTSAVLPDHAPFPISFWNWVGLALVALFAFVIYRRLRRDKGVTEED